MLPGVQAVAVTRTGDVWKAGSHQLICGSALEERTFQDLLGRERAQMVFADPPYNLKSKTYSGKGKHQHGDFAMAAGDNGTR